MPTPQSYKNHAKFDPFFHFTIIPLLMVNLGVATALWRHHHEAFPFLTIWWIVLSITLLLMAFRTRIYALRNQDRLIRLEERLRLTALLPPTEHAVIHALTTKQLIALRFASDAELPGLARRTLAENLDPKQIKQAITTWHPDHTRI